MNRKGIVSTIGTNTARVQFPELEDSVSYELPIAKHISMVDFHVGEEVLVCFYNNNFKSGIIMARMG
ncbi:hypothetical protein ST12_08265 [Clostridium botulinum]|uniref:Uncharacterized protein n=1 Tax=Clostridium botulinum TaxID=1491 RepID=A0A6B4QV43_CLOBO|nr:MULTISPECIES: phage baseplate assembly protein V [Clostridium]ACD54013.1 putative phage baseplate assembly protein V [Clostridium botulinum E3 str. Alaska E43]AJF29682.1 hypothetical protein ST13_08265 [Clostridium botulinum]AJF32743.1 hypothetical protein ST12_08265 [Clostridium botulinum]MBN1077701.1 hypothetical protein [Clostridium botulinum]MBY6949072.1 hypothetical protein [Clostridium botulinum]